MKDSQKEMVLAALEKFNSVEVIAGGWSMWPFIRNGDTIRIKKNGHLFPGKVGVFFLGEQLIAHRIIWMSKKEGEVFCWLSGDAAGPVSSKVKATEIIGLVDKIGKKWKIRTLWVIYPFCLFSPVIGFILVKFWKRIEFINSRLKNYRNLWYN